MRIVLILVFCAIQTLAFAQEGEVKPKNWAVKTDLLNPIFNSGSLEAERRMGKNWTMAVRFGLTGGKPVYEEFKGKLFGYYAKVGPKFYLSEGKREALAGFAIQPQLMYSYWRDWDANLFGNKGARWENSVGLIVQGSYTFVIGKSLRLEPMVGIGYAPTFYSENWPNDTPTDDPTANHYRWLKEDWYYVDQPSRTHIPLPIDLAVSVGLQFGIAF